ncbi:MAG: sulfotransferase [Roseovarius sp.]
MARLMMMLSPPRSFSSLVSTMIGQHPQIYGFPELHLMVRETLGETIRWERKREQWLGPPGMLRTMAQLMYGGQTTQNVMEAANWLQDRLHWKSADVMDFIMDKAEEVEGTPICLEKTPTLSFEPDALERVRQAWPDALYVHVTRHPVNLKKSIDEYIQNMPRMKEDEKPARLAHAMTVWPVTQRNILDFCATLAPGQYLRIKGEDVLADAPRMMRQVAEWAGVRTDDEAVQAMLRPEESPYASLGPAGATWGNDVKFVSSPVFRPGTPRLGSLSRYLEDGQGKDLTVDRKEYLTQLAHCLGYE